MSAERKLPSPRKQSYDYNSPQLQSSLIWFVLEGTSDGLISTVGLSRYSWEPKENENHFVILLDTGCVGHWKWPRNLSLAEGRGEGSRGCNGTWRYVTESPEDCPSLRVSCFWWWLPGITCMYFSGYCWLQSWQDINRQEYVCLRNSCN